VDPASSDASRLVPGIGDARSVAVGCTFSCALRAGGEVSCWGDLPDWPAGAEPFSIAGVSDAAELEAGCHHACVRTGAGEILCWGGNERGQLGAGRVSHAEPPVRLPYAGDLFVLDRATCVDRGGGALTCFGEVPGVPERADQPAPVSVSILPPR
jgi:alpha-tubulin suppressor-like RCC1 family protein